MKRARSFEARVEQYVDKSGPCWIWTRSLNAKGYGICAEGLVHRASYKTFVGPIEDGKYVLHKCDVRNCCNPDHLYVGTQKDNMKDCIDRGRRSKKGQPAGERHSLSKLTEANAIELIQRSRFATASFLASEYGIGLTQVRRIISGKRWKHLDEYRKGQRKDMEKSPENVYR